MKVAYLFGSLNRGGTETLLLDVLKHRRFQAIGLYRRKEGALENDFLNSGTPMFYQPVGKNIAAYLLKLRRLLQEQQVTHIHAQQPLDALYARWATLGTGIRLILSFHGYDTDASSVGRMVIRSVIKATDLNIFVSHAQQSYYISRYGLKAERQQVVYNGISWDKFNGEEEVPSLRKELHLPDDILLLTMVGNFNEVRDQMTVCRFFSLLHAAGIAFHGIFAGRRVDHVPELYDSCVRFCHENDLSEHVSFLGVRNDVPEILKQSDAFIYATDHDTFGIAVVEAMYTGIPVFVNDWEVMREVTEEGRLATLYPTKDAQALMAIFQRFMDNKTDFQKKAQLASDTVQQKYSIEKHIEELMEIYGVQCDTK